jgi:hypothetical protein
MRSLRSFAATVPFWPDFRDLAGMREIRAIVRHDFFIF